MNSDQKWQVSMSIQRSIMRLCELSTHRYSGLSGAPHQPPQLGRGVVSWSRADSNGLPTSTLSSVKMKPSRF
jgi:hypothetical protein